MVLRSWCNIAVRMVNFLTTLAPWSFGDQGNDMVGPSNREVLGTVCQGLDMPPHWTWNIPPEVSCERATQTIWPLSSASRYVNRDNLDSEGSSFGAPSFQTLLKIHADVTALDGSALGGVVVAAFRKGNR